MFLLIITSCSRAEVLVKPSIKTSGVYMHHSSVNMIVNYVSKM